MRAKNSIRFFLLFIVVEVIANACLEPFNPALPEKKMNVLVVEGYINAGKGVTRIRLSRVAPLKAKDQQLYEDNAEVWIENDANETFALSGTNAGRYETDTLILPTDREYHLAIKLANGKTYRSESQRVKITPPIDSIHWEWKDQLYLYANSHDNQAETHFYNWTFQEDWQILSQYRAQITYDAVNNRLVPIDPNEALRLRECWGKDFSREIAFASTLTLNKDAVKGLLTTIPAGSDRTQSLYVISVQQRTMTKEEYDYIVLVKKNSEIHGSFFDPMPSQLFGNIHQTEDPEEVVIGYIGTYTTQTFRYFLDGTKLPPHPVQEKCPPVEFDNAPVYLRAYLSNPKRLLPYQLNDNDVIALPAICMDCRLKPNAKYSRPDYDFP